MLEDKNSKKVEYPKTIDSKSRDILSLLKEYNKLRIELTLTSIVKIGKADIDLLYKIIFEYKPQRCNKTAKRAKCPINKYYSRGIKSLGKYKLEMINYINSNWNINLDSKSAMIFSPSLLEALANYLEENY